MPLPRNINIHYKTKAILCAVLLTLTQSNSQAATGLDVITMRNGDIHNGTAALERYSIKTVYSIISVPYLLMQKLTLGDQEHPDEIWTVFGERFSGKITDQAITALRLTAPTLPISISDIASIEFSHPQQPTTDIKPPDGIEMSNGDRFHGRIIHSDYLLKGDASIHLFKRDDIHIIDVDPNPEQKGNRAQLTPISGKVVQGELITSSIRTLTRYGETIYLPLAALNTLAFNTQRLSRSTDFHYRSTIDPSTLLQDRMADGTPGPLMARLPGGKYKRGDLQGDGDSDEKPPITMQIKPFAIGVYEVTFDEYELFCSDTGRDRPDDGDWGRGRRPVINVTWEDAIAYTKWLSRRTGHSYRLPSDAEWEYAARAHSTTRYWWGQQVDKPRANCEGCGSIWDGEKSSLVGRFPPNRFGLHDTAGNVFEWVADCLHDDFSTDPSDGSAVDRPQCGKRVVRGGAWSFPPKEIRSANRWRDFPTRSSDDTGFRVARDLR